MTKKRQDTKTLLGILLMIAGLAAGVFLVMQAQYFRNKAKESETYTICHYVDSEKLEWVELEVSREELGDYLNQGDKFGECP